MGWGVRFVYPGSMANKNARKLRGNPTDADQRLWSRLRRRQVDGHRFRRQAPLGPYVVDFLCYEARLIAEIQSALRAFPPPSASG